MTGNILWGKTLEVFIDKMWKLPLPGFCNFNSKTAQSSWWLFGLCDLQVPAEQDLFGAAHFTTHRYA
jgi:hypothetical protein